MDVYLVEKGCYNDRWIAGVAYSSSEAARAAHPVPREGINGDPQKGQAERPGGWQGNDDEGWSNGLDWGDAAQIYRCEVET